MNIRSEGSAWAIFDGEREVYVTRKAVNKKELVSLAKKVKHPDGVVLRASATGLICYGCPDKSNCAHREALDARLQPHMETFSESVKDVPGLKFDEIIKLQGIDVECKVALKTTPFSATLIGSADRINHNQMVRLIAGPMPGGPYSILVTETPGSYSLGQPIRGEATDLAPNSEYFYVVQIVEDGQVLIQSKEKSFRTKSFNPRPVINKVVKHSSATVECEAFLVPNDKLLQIVYWEEGKEDQFKILNRVSGQGNHGQKVEGTMTGLKPKTAYFYVLQIVDPVNNHVIEESEDWWFETSDYIATVYPVENILASSATIRGSADWLPKEQSLRLIYGTGDEAFETDPWTGLDTKSQMGVTRINNLKEDTDYWVISQVVDSASNKVLYESKAQKFKTLPYNLVVSNAEVKAGTARITGSGGNLSENEELQIVVNGTIVEKTKGRGLPVQHLLADLKDLVSYTDYECKIIVSRDGEGISSISTIFTTQGYSPYTIGTTNIKDRTATLMGAADFIPPNYYSRFRWGTSKDNLTDASQLMFGTNQETQTFAFMAYGLIPSTKYYYVLEVLGSDSRTVLDCSDPDTFTTAPQRRSVRKY